MLDAAVETLRQHARVVLHFHPDRIGVKPITVAEALLEEGRYRSQFETGLSSGGLTVDPAICGSGRCLVAHTTVRRPRLAIGRSMVRWS
jgi:hypothetical protein